MSVVSVPLISDIVRSSRVDLLPDIRSYCPWRFLRPLTGVLPVSVLSCRHWRVLRPLTGVLPVSVSSAVVIRYHSAGGGCRRELPHHTDAGHHARGGTARDQRRRQRRAGLCPNAEKVATWVLYILTNAHPTFHDVAPRSRSLGGSAGAPCDKSLGQVFSIIPITLAKYIAVVLLTCGALVLVSQRSLTLLYELTDII